MADPQNDSSPKPPTQREAQEALEKQIAQLKREIGKINRVLAERAEEAMEEDKRATVKDASTTAPTTAARRKISRCL